MEKYGLTEKETELLKSAFEKFSQVETVFIYGSRAKNTFRKTSDIDLAVRFKNGNDASMAQLKSELDDLPIIHEIDLTDEAQIEAGDFKDEYERTKQIFYLKGWKTTTLGEVLNIKNGKSRPKNGKIYPVYGGNGVLGYADEYNVDEEIIIIGRVGAYCGCIYFENKKFWLSDNALGVLANENSNIKFLYYLLKQLNLNKQAIGGAQPLLTQGLINQIEVIVPKSIEEQRAIAAVLSSLDDKIELLREQNKTLEATAQAIFKEWFVNFNFPGATGKTIDSELGKIPEGWRVGKLGEEFKIEYGKSDKNFDADGLHPVYGAGGIVGYSNFADYRDYQVIIGCRGTCGNITLAYEDSKITHNSLIISSDWFKPFIYLYLHSVDIGKAITGSTQPQITIGDLDNIEILIPQNKIVSTFVEIIAPIFKKKGNNNSQIQTLATFRDALLPKLMKGELRVNGFID